MGNFLIDLIGITIGKEVGEKVFSGGSKIVGFWKVLLSFASWWCFVDISTDYAKDASIALMILGIAVILALIAYFCYCVYKIETTRIMYSDIFQKVCFVVMVLVYALDLYCVEGQINALLIFFIVMAFMATWIPKMLLERIEDLGKKSMLIEDIENKIKKYKANRKKWEEKKMKKKMMKKIRMMLCTIAVFSLILAGCGDTGGTDNGGDGGTDNKTGEAPALSEILYGNDVSVWYVCRTIDKEYIPDVYVMYGDGTYLKDSEYTLGELSGMTDEEIVTWAESRWEAAGTSIYCSTHLAEVEALANDLGYGDVGYYVSCRLANQSYESPMAETEEELQQINDRIQEGVEVLESKIKETLAAEGGVPKYRYGLSLYTDSSGNNVEKEIIWFENDNARTSIEIVSETEPAGGEVYESLYGGRQESNGNYFTERIENAVMLYNFDTIGTEGILVDEEVQFE